MLTNTGSIEEYKGLNKLTKKSAPLVVIPTTAGTGSEVTIFTIITDTAKNVKMPIGSPGNNPRQATKDEIVQLYRLAYAQ